MHVIAKSDIDALSIDSIGEYFAEDDEEMLPPKVFKCDWKEEIKVDLGHNRVSLTVQDWCAIHYNSAPMELCRSEY